MSLKQILKLWPLFLDIAHNIECLHLYIYSKLPALHMKKMNSWLSAKNTQETNFDFRQSLGTTKFHVHSLGIVLKMW